MISEIFFGEISKSLKVFSFPDETLSLFSNNNCSLVNTLKRVFSNIEIIITDKLNGI